MSARTQGPYAVRVIDNGRLARPTGGAGRRRDAASFRSARTPHALTPRFRARIPGFPFFPPVRLKGAE
jgi:hypothetical protein